jgi:hypothetical protein
MCLKDEVGSMTNNNDCLSKMVHGNATLFVPWSLFDKIGVTVCIMYL